MVSAIMLSCGNVSANKSQGRDSSKSDDNDWPMKSFGKLLQVKFSVHRA